MRRHILFLLLYLYSSIVRIIAIAMLLWALADNPQGYYQLLRWVTTGVAGYYAYITHKGFKRGWTYTFGVIVVLFNPIIPIRFDMEIWTLIDIIVAVIIFVSIFVFKVRTKILTFSFIVSEVFLENSNYRITIPVRFFEKYVFAKKQDATITTPNGSIDAYIHYLKTEQGDYLQIYTKSPYFGMDISKLEVDDIIDGEIYGFNGDIFIDLEPRKFWTQRLWTNEKGTDLFINRARESKTKRNRK